MCSFIASFDDSLSLNGHRLHNNPQINLDSLSLVRDIGGALNEVVEMKQLYCNASGRVGQYQLEDVRGIEDAGDCMFRVVNRDNGVVVARYEADSLDEAADLAEEDGFEF